jgi:hypothetical protein
MPKQEKQTTAISLRVPTAEQGLWRQASIAANMTLAGWIGASAMPR